VAEPVVGHTSRADWRRRAACRAGCRCDAAAAAGAAAGRFHGPAEACRRPGPRRQPQSPPDGLGERRQTREGSFSPITATNSGRSIGWALTGMQNVKPTTDQWIRQPNAENRRNVKCQTDNRQPINR